MKSFIMPELVACSDYDVSYAMGCPMGTVDHCGTGYRRS